MANPNNTTPLQYPSDLTTNPETPYALVIETYQNEEAFLEQTPGSFSPRPSRFDQGVSGIVALNRDLMRGIENSVQGTRLSKATSKNDAVIALPMPHSINRSDGWNWGSKDFGSLRNQITNDLLNAIQGSGRGFTSIHRLNSTIADLALGSGVFEASTRVNVNPRKEMLFEEPTPRSMSIEYDFAPRNRQDSEILKEIIKLIKMNAAPSFVGGANANRNLYRYPSEFQLYFMTNNPNKKANPENPTDDSTHEFIPLAGRMALTAFTTNYTNSGIAAFLENDSATHMKVTMEFTELELLSRQDYEQNF